MRQKLAFSIICLLLIYGCAGYPLSSSKQATFTESVSKSLFTVTFCGNAYMSKKEAEKYALQRASEITLEKGFTHYVVVERKDASQFCMLKDVPRRESSQMQTETIGNTEFPSNTDKGIMSRPNLTLKIQCYRINAPEGAIDAQKYLDEQFSGLQFPAKKY